MVRASIVFLTVLCALVSFAKESFSAALKTECIGSDKATHFLVYLHGFESPKALSGEEEGNRRVLEKLAAKHSLRVAIPQGPLCSNGKRCWPAKTPKETEETFKAIQAAAEACRPLKGPYSLLGFSNGGYFAFKLYKIHKDPFLRHILASGSSGLWDAGDKPNSFSDFDLMIGSKDMTLGNAKNLETKFRAVVPAFRLHIFEGGHVLNYETLEKLLPFK